MCGVNDNNDGNEVVCVLASLNEKNPLKTMCVCVCS